MKTFLFVMVTMITVCPGCIIQRINRNEMQFDVRIKSLPVSAQSTGILSNIANHGLCREECKKKELCTAYSWKTDRKCTLWKGNAKFDKVGNRKGNIHTEYTTGIAVNPARDFTPGKYTRVPHAWAHYPKYPAMYHLMGKMYHGFDECEAACERTDQCNGYSWHDVSPECYLWREMTIWRNNDKSWNTGYIS